MINVIKDGNFKRNLVCAVIPACFIALFIEVGFFTKHEQGMHFTLLRVLFLLMLALILTAGIFFLFRGLDKANRRPGKLSFFDKKIKSSFLFSLLSMAFLFICWFPYFLAFYPGLFAYDAQWQYFMYAGGTVSEHQPVLHTYMLGFIVNKVYTLTGSINKGIAAYTIFQEILMLLGCGYIFDLLHRRRVRTSLYIFTFAFFAFFPTIVIFVFTSIKDSIFAVALACFLLLNLSYYEDSAGFFKKKSNVVMWVILALTVCIFRNNAIYAVIPTLPFFCIFIIKNRKILAKSLIMLFATAVIFIAYKYPITNALTTTGTSVAEKLSVPCQQIKRVYAYHYDELSDFEKSEEERYFDNELTYNYYVPEIADAAKGCLRNDVYEADTEGFWKLWLQLFKEYPEEYINSFLENTYGFYYPWPKYVIYPYGDEAYTNMHIMEPGVANSKLPRLLSIMRNFETGDIVMSDTWISWLFAPATYMYLALLVGFYLLRNKEYSKTISVLFTALFWCTFLLGPVAMPRYALYLFFLVPVWGAYVFKKGARANDV